MVMKPNRIELTYGQAGNAVTSRSDFFTKGLKTGSRPTTQARRMPCHRPFDEPPGAGSSSCIPCGRKKRWPARCKTDGRSVSGSGISTTGNHGYTRTVYSHGTKILNSTGDKHLVGIFMPQLKADSQKWKTANQKQWIST
jgi:hypothetical protein